MRISWVTFGAAQRRSDGSLTSTLASLRYRVLAPIAAMSSGYLHRIVPIGAKTPQAQREAAIDADVLVFSKSFLPENEDLATKARARGVEVIFDVCDNHYQHPSYGDHYRRMTALADQIVCNTAEMAQVAAPYARGTPVVIEDPYEGPRGAPRFAPGERLRLLWFGHPSNLDSLQAVLPDLAGYAARRALSLRVLTQPSPGLEAVCEQARARFGPGLEISVEPWSLEAQWRELAACDAVIIPSLQTEQKRVKSANRMVEALWAGRPVAAQPMPAYRPFEAWTPVRATLSEGLAALEADAASWIERLSAAQAFIAKNHDPAALGRQWKDLISARCAQRTATQ